MQGRVPLPGSLRPAQRESRRIGDVDPERVLDLTVTLARPDGVDEVGKALDDLGFAIIGPAGGGRSLRIRGTAATVERVFAPGLGRYRNDEQGEFIGRDGEISIPAGLEHSVSGVFGLDKRRVARRRGAPRHPGVEDGLLPAADDRSGVAGVSTAAALTPAQVASHYRFPAGTGAGQTVAIAEFGGGYFASDLNTFCQRQGTPLPVVTPVSVNGAELLTLEQIEQLPAQQRQQQLDDSVEVNMDVQIVAGLAPAARILVYFSDFDEQGWVDMLDEVIDQKPAGALTLSVSWGLAEDDPDWSAGAVQAIDQRLQAAAAIGITVCAAAGDDGSADQEDDGRAHVDFPASSPHALAVGGTMLDGEVDVVWWQAPGERTSSGGGATGGGVSTIFPKPSWQDGVEVASINPDSIVGRIVPDIAALAGPPYYELIFMGQDAPNGGTSGATPTWASLLALMAASATPWRPAFMAPLLYAAGPDGKTVGAAGCVDVISGNNISSTLGRGYSAGPGFDAVSGWGVPDGVALLAALTDS